MTRDGTAAGDDRSLSVLSGELFKLVAAYARQETLDPLKALGRFVAFGVAGAIMVGAGGVLITLAAVRAVQSETGHHLGGDLSWVPYLAGVLVAGLGAIWSLGRISRGLR